MKTSLHLQREPAGIRPLTSTRQLRIIWIALLWLLPVLVQAQTIYYVKLTGAGTQTGSSWNNAFSAVDLERAINTAAAHAPAQVWIAAGAYSTAQAANPSFGFSMKKGVTIYGGFAGTETQPGQRPAVTQSQPSSTTLSGSLRLYNVILNEEGLDNTAILDGVVIQDGYAVDPESRESQGVGMYTKNGSPTVRNCHFVNNYIFYGWGGACISRVVTLPC